MRVSVQDMLDKLWAWVALAEADMAESEACPIGEDLEAVEKQLADHEVRGRSLVLWLRLF